MKVVVHQAVVVFEALLLEEFIGLGPEFPPRRHITAWALATQRGNDLNALVHDRLFLLGRHGDRVLVRIAVHADLVAGIGDRLHLLGKGLDGMTGDEPGGLDAPFVEQAKEPLRADLAREHAARDIAG